MELGLSLGSNLGDRLANLREAKRLIGLLQQVSITAQSSVCETSPVDVCGEFAHLPFLNAVLLIESNRSPGTLLPEFKKIEKHLGRRPVPDRNAPRPIDIDIIFAGDLWLNDGDVLIPHPRWSSRRFVVQPLNELRPDLRLPGQVRTVREVLLTLPDDQKVVACEEVW
ncbi:MAG: 2-amino-4-hydroxy-6-hydroxymethyldihydropteridine diphosphokinase [bacterium]